MYKFTNGIVVYDKKTADQYIKAGMKLVEEKVEPFKEKKQKAVEHEMIEPKEEKEETENEINSNSDFIGSKFRKSPKIYR